MNICNIVGVIVSHIHKGDPRPRIPPCVIASSAMGLKLGVFGFLHTMRCFNTCKFIFMLRPQQIQWTYAQTWGITVISITVKTRIPPIWATCWDQNGAGTEISLVYLWIVCIFVVNRNLDMNNFIHWDGSTEEILVRFWCDLCKICSYKLCLI